MAKLTVLDTCILSDIRYVVSYFRTVYPTGGKARSFLECLGTELFNAVRAGDSDCPPIDSYEKAILSCEESAKESLKHKDKFVSEACQKELCRLLYSVRDRIALRVSQFSEESCCDSPPKDTAEAISWYNFVRLKEKIVFKWSILCEHDIFCPALDVNIEPATIDSWRFVLGTVCNLNTALKSLQNLKEYYASYACIGSKSLNASSTYYYHPTQCIQIVADLDMLSAALTQYICTLFRLYPEFDFQNTLL